jgi:hypothetical protein
MVKKISCILILLALGLFADGEQGFSYRGGVDFTPKYYSIPHASYSFGLGLGCEGFNLEASFRSLLSGEAIKNYLQGNLQAIISAAPMLLLEYASPTLADTLKHLQNRSQELLHLNYLTCQDVMKAGEDYLSRLRKENQAKEIQKNTGEDLQVAMQQVSQDTSLKNISNYNGQPIGSGKLKIVQDGLTWAKAPDETKKVASQIIGDVIIDGNGKLTYQEVEKTPNQLFVEYRNDYEQKITMAVNYYLSSGRVNSSDLEKISLPAFPVKDVVIKSIGDLKSPKREMAIGKLASTLAHLKLITELNDLHFALTRAKQNPTISDTTKEVLDQKIVMVEGIKRNINLEKETTEEYFSRTVNSIIAEAETDKMKTFQSVVPHEVKKEPSPSNNRWYWGGVAW